MPAHKTEVSPQVEQFERIIRAAATTRSREWDNLEWPPALARLAQAEYRAALDSPLDLQVRSEAQTALKLAILPPLRSLIFDASHPTLRVAGLVMAMQFANPLVGRGAALDNTYTLEQLKGLTTVAGLADLFQEIGWFPKESRPERLPAETRSQFAELLAGLRQTPLDQTFAQLRNAGLTEWYSAVCALDRQKNGPLPQREAESALPPLDVPGVYVERPLELQRLNALAGDESRGLASVEGAAGMGKTTLVLAWARAVERTRIFYDGVFWVEGGGYADRAARLYARLKVTDDEDFNRWLRTRRALVIIDDPEDPALVAWLSQQKSVLAVVVVISRFSAWLEQAMPAPRRIYLAGLQVDEAQRLVAGLMAQTKGDAVDSKSVQQVGEQVAWNPHLLVTLAPQGDKLGWAEVLKVLRAKLDRPLDAADADFDQKVRRVLDISYERLTEDQQRWLRRLAGCVGRVSSFPLSAAQWALECSNEAEAASRLAGLIGANLIVRTRELDYPECAGERFTLHWITWRFLRDKSRQLGETFPVIPYQDFARAWFSPENWWRPTMRGSGSIWQSLLEPRLWLVPAAWVETRTLRGRLKVRQADLLKRYWSQEVSNLPLEVIAAAECLRQRSNALLSRRHYIPVIVILGIVLLVLAVLHASVWVALVMIVAIYLILEYPSMVHQTNYYRFLRRWLLRGKD